MIFIECPTDLSVQSCAAMNKYWKEIVGEERDAPKLVLLGSGLRVVAASSDLDLVRVKLESSEEEIVSQVLESALVRAKSEDTRPHGGSDE